MAYIYLDDLKKILPGILDSWIDEDDESWEWIFSEIEQKCYIGGIERKNKKGKKWKKAIENSIDDLNQRVSDFIKDYGADIRRSTEEIDKLSNKVGDLSGSNAAMISRINSLSNNVEAAKSMAQTAKQRTEVDYSKYSSRPEIEYSDVFAIIKCMGERGATLDELNMVKEYMNKYIFRCRMFKTTVDNKNNPEDKDCKTCKYYCGDGVIKEPCIGCENYNCWEAKDIPIEKICMTCKFDCESGCIYSGDLCHINHEHWEAKDE